MLKGLDPLLHPDLLAALAAMGHGDELAIVDHNFPAASTAARLVRLDGADLIRAGRAVLSVFPLDGYVDRPFAGMDRVESPGDVPPVQEELRRLAEQVEGRPVRREGMERFAFYERARRAFAVLATGELAPYGDVILVKGVVGASS